MSDRYGSIGSSPGPISISGPFSLAHQCSGSTPLEKYKHAKRTGGFALAAPLMTSPVCAARNGNDSSHGNASETPAPRRKFRRLTLCDHNVLFIRFLFR